MEQRLLLIKFLLAMTCLMCGINCGDTYQKSSKMNQITDGMMKMRKMNTQFDNRQNHDMIIGYNVGPTILKFFIPSEVLRTTPISYSVMHMGLESSVTYDPMPQMDKMDQYSLPSGWHSPNVGVHY